MNPNVKTWRDAKILGDYVLRWGMIGPKNKRRERFLLLAPQRHRGEFRRTVAAGEFRDGRCFVDYGVLSPGLEQRILEQREAQQLAREKGGG